MPPACANGTAENPAIAPVSTLAPIAWTMEQIEPLVRAGDERHRGDVSRFERMVPEIERRDG
jgi:hypothetical protein